MSRPTLPGRTGEPADGPAAERLEREFDELAARAVTGDPAAVQRVRTQVVAEFRLRSTDLPARGASPWHWPLRRRPAIAFALAIGLLAGGVGVVAADSGPGQPFYGLRLAAEELALPASGDARLRGQLGRLDQRLVEARQAAQAGDARAVAAALDAYRDELAGLETEATSSGLHSAPILDALTTHEVVLHELETVLPSAAAGGIEQAIDQADRTSKTLRAGHGPSASPGQPAPAQPTRPGGAATPGAGRTPPPAATPTATPSLVAPPAASPRPTH